MHQKWENKLRALGIIYALNGSDDRSRECFISAYARKRDDPQLEALAMAAEALPQLLRDSADELTPLREAQGLPPLSHYTTLEFTSGSSLDR